MFRKILTVLIFVVFLFSSVPVFFAVTMRYSFLDSDFYKTTLLDTAYEPFIQSLVSEARNFVPVIPKSMTERELRDLFRKYYPKSLFISIIDATASDFIADVRRGSSLFADKKMRLVFHYGSLVQPTRQLLDDLRVDEVHTREFMQALFPSTDAEYTKAVVLGISRQDTAFFIRQFENVHLYFIFFLFAFMGLMLLLWIPSFWVGLKYSGLLWICAALLSLLLAAFATRIDSLFSSEIQNVANSSLEIADSLRSILHVVAVAFAKMYGIVCLFVLFPGFAVYFAGSFYQRKTSSFR